MKSGERMEGECDSCHFGPVAIQVYDGADDIPARMYPEKKLCDLCASTPAGNEIDGGTDRGDVLATICYVGNAILRALEK